MHLLSEPTVSHLLRSLTPSECHSFLSALSAAVVTVSSQSSSSSTENLVHQPLRTTITTKDNNLSLFMPVSNTTTTGIKIVTASAAHGIIGVINIFSPEGKLLGLLSAAEITAFRTALAIMTLFVRCPTRRIRRERIVIFGSGRQAEWHARLVLLLSSSEGEGEEQRQNQVRRIVFVNRGKKRLEEMRGLADELTARYPGLEVEMLAKEGTDTADYEAKLREELTHCDVVFSCTPATEPNWRFADLGTGTKKSRFIGLIGSYKPYMREIDTETLLSGDQGRVFVDSKEACLEESGELIAAGVGEEQLVEVGGLYGGMSEGETIDVEEGRNVVFKCVGMGIMDLVVGKMLLDVAQARGLGMEVDGF
ncbi:proline dehydrogenase [Aspergillus nanangensis]|uniref:Proline dehydrogenase n=1 Tax=Aspergillus nanangensis TaxID=2582783 RepID=A0AAD4CPU1_ASPNN|nr:proline dehydrogenase [Aspergillus nanangensis]